MSTREIRTAPPARSPAAGLPGIRRESFAMAVLLLMQYGLGIGVNLFVTLPAKDHGAGLAAPSPTARWPCRSTPCSA